MIKTTIKVDGMACGMCEAHVNDTVRRSFTTKKVHSSYKKGEIIIITENDISEDKLREVIDTTGYKIISITKNEL